MSTEARFRREYENEKQALDRLVASNRLSAGEDKAARLLNSVFTKGLERCLAARKSNNAKEELSELLEDFHRFGARAILLTGAQRGGDFLNNQLRGQWAEKVAISMAIDGWEIRPFGPSGAAMPGEEDHRKVIMAFKEIYYLEGKRPDLLVFKSSSWQALSEAQKRQVATWPERCLAVDETGIVRKATCGIEVKNSTWHYGTRRKAGGTPLSITVKDEELEGLKSWADKTGLPVVFLQVLFDELYCMSYLRMLAAMKRGHLYRQDDYIRDAQTGAGEKLYHRFLLEGTEHFCGQVEFPSQSKAIIQVLADGNVVPYIAYAPALASGIKPDVILREVAYRDD